MNTSLRGSNKCQVILPIITLVVQAFFNTYHFFINILGSVYSRLTLILIHKNEVYSKILQDNSYKNNTNLLLPIGR